MIPWYLQLVIFTLACSVIGWFTNVVAVKMLFRPREPERLLGLVFQGVLPKHQPHFARQLAEALTKDFITTGEMVQKLDAAGLYAALRPMVDRTFAEVVEDLRGRMTEPQRLLLSPAVVESVRRQIEREVEAELPAIVAQVQARADELVNLTDLLAEKLVAIGPARLEALIYRVARKELRFIELYGGVFGFIIGALQFGLVRAISVPFSEPVVGALVGTVTNYLAIQMLFLPRLPTRVLLTTVQGLFPKRQELIARELAHIAASEFVVAGEIFGLLAERMLPRRADLAVFAQYEAMLTARFPAVRALLEATLSAEQLDAFRSRLAVHYANVMPAIADALVRTAAEQLDVGAIIEGKLAGLSKLTFEELIRGLFKQEELYLVIYGALLGAVMGGIQLGLTWM